MTDESRSGVTHGAIPEQLYAHLPLHGLSPTQTTVLAAEVAFGGAQNGILGDSPTGADVPSPGGLSQNQLSALQASINTANVNAASAVARVAALEQIISELGAGAVLVKSIVLNTIGAQVVGIAVTEAGSLIGYTSPPPLQFSLNAGTSWSAPFAAASANSFSFTFTPTAVAASSTVLVRDATNTAINVVSNGFAVAAAGTPAAPTLTATPGDGQVSLAWTDGATGGAPIASHLLERQIGNGAWASLGVIVQPSPHPDLGLTNGVAYSYRISATNQANLTSTPSNVVTATPVAVTTAPAAPTLTATASSGQVTLSWTDGATGGSAITGHLLEEKVGTGAWTTLGTIMSASPYIVTGLTNGTAYGFRISAINSVGTGAASNVVTATPAVNNGATLTGNALLLAGTTATSANTPQTTANTFASATSAFKITSAISTATIAGVTQQIASIWSDAGDGTQCNWIFQVANTGCFQFAYFDAAGTFGSVMSTVPIPAAALYVRTSVAPTANGTGTIDFLTSTDGVNYTELGTQQTFPGVGWVSGVKGSGAIRIGDGFAGTIGRTTIAIAGANVLDFNPAVVSAGATSVPDGVSGTWTLIGGATIGAAGTTSQVVQAPGSASGSLAITGTMLSSLTNTMGPGQTLLTPGFSGLSGTVTWTMTQNVNSTRFSCNPLTGVVTNNQRLTVQACPITLTASNGTTSVSRSFDATATNVDGKVYDIGPGRAYPTIDSAAAEIYYAIQNGTISGTPIFQINWDANPRTYYGDNAAYPGYDFGHAQWPHKFVGVPNSTTGQLPTVGGGGGYWGKGYFTCFGDADHWIENLEIRDVRINSDDNLGGVVVDGSCTGQVTISNCYIHNNSNGLRGEAPAASVTVVDSIICRCGDGEFGHTHNIYFQVYSFLAQRVKSFDSQVGHCVKSRGTVTTYIDCEFFDSLMGRASYVCDLPNGGIVSMTRVKIRQGAMAQNAALVTFGVETGGYDQYGRVQLGNANNSLAFTDCDFNSVLPVGYPHPGASQGLRSNSAAGVALPATAAGGTAPITFSNCRTSGILPANFAVVAGATTSPSGVTFATETPPLATTTRLLNGLVPAGPGPWTTPNDPTNNPNDGGSYFGSMGQIDPGLFEIRVSPTAPVSTVLCTLKAWGNPRLASSDPGFSPFDTGATWSIIHDDGVSQGQYTPNVPKEASGYFGLNGNQVVTLMTNMTPGDYQLHVNVASAAGPGTYHADAFITITVSTTSVVSGGLTAALTAPQRCNADAGT